LRQGVVEGQKVEQKLEACLGAARGMAAVVADRALKGARQSTQGGAAQRDTGRAGEHTAGHCRGGQTFRTAGYTARRA
jgi:hypothetical protein